MKGLKVFALFALVMTLCSLAVCQVSEAPAAAAEPTNIYAAGLSYNVGGSPAIAGMGLYARKVSGVGTYAFTAVDVLPATTHPLTVTTNFSTGIAQRVVTIGKIPIYIPTSAGISYGGGNTGWAWTTGALASIRLKDNLRLMPNVRLVKSSVSGGAGYQPIVGMLVGWGQ